LPNDVVTQAIDRVASGHDLSAGEAAAVLREIMEGRVGDVQTGAFLIALRTKGETVDEVAGLASTMRELALRVEVDQPGLVDTAGTGGGAPSFNVSTTAALLAAAAGAKIAKHGNRSATGRCGSADVLEALGARIDLEPGAIVECIDDVGFGFMFAPMHHQATRYVVPVRRELAVRTIFNLLGPLTNPAGASRQLVGETVGKGEECESVQRGQCSGPSAGAVHACEQGGQLDVLDDSERLQEAHPLEDDPDPHRP